MMMMMMMTTKTMIHTHVISLVCVPANNASGNFTLSIQWSSHLQQDIQFLPAPRPDESSQYEDALCCIIGIIFPLHRHNSMLTTIGWKLRRSKSAVRHIVIQIGNLIFFLVQFGIKFDNNKANLCFWLKWQRTGVAEETMSTTTLPALVGQSQYCNRSVQWTAHQLTIAIWLVQRGITLPQTISSPVLLTGL